ncbi:MAG: hypothetical protein ABIH21_03980 [Patescibacteria group bacterium]
MGKNREHSAGNEPEHKDAKLWSFFNEYKTPGIGKAIARPDIDSFSHLPDQTKEKDKALLEQKQAHPGLLVQHETGPDAFAFENFLTTQAHNNNWFGGEFSPTNVYDDWISGADAYVEWTDENGSPVRLAIDFTAAKQFTPFWNKSDKLEGNVQLKYLRSAVENDENSKPKETKIFIPIVILGVDSSVYRLVAKNNDTVGPDYPLKRLLLEQTKAQIDLQIVLLIHKTFESSRAKRSKGVGDSQNQYKALGDNYSAEQAIKFFTSLDEEVVNAVMNEKQSTRMNQLMRIKKNVDEQVAQAEQIELNDEWQEVVKNSKTHNILACKE